jgi:hypothetical protein
MFGRSGRCLLALSLLMSAPLPSSGQTHSANLRDTPPNARQLPHIGEFPIPEPAPIVPRFPVRPPARVSLPQIARPAGMIFSGRVTGIERRPAARGQALETIAVTFRVEDAIRGATPGENLTISQWIGLWSGGQRYRVGQRVLVFLYPPSKLGLTSSVAGAMGRFEIDSWGRVLFTAQHLSAFQQDPVLGGKSHVRLSDFALAVRRASEEE